MIHKSGNSMIDNVVIIALDYVKFIKLLCDKDEGSFMNSYLRFGVVIAMVIL